MKLKIVLYFSLLMFVVSGLGCFALVESGLDWLCKDKPEPVAETEQEDSAAKATVIVVKTPLVVRSRTRWWGPGSWLYQYEYQYQYLPGWHQRWLYDTGGRCWWLDYNIDPIYWPRPKPYVSLGTPIERRIMIPRAAKEGIDRYVDDGCPTGSFLHAVLANDLFEAVARADEGNQYALAGICKYIYNYTPIACHGSQEKVSDWLKFHKEKPEEAHTAAGADREKREHYYE